MRKTSRAGMIAAPEIEGIECHAWLDLFAAAPPDYAAAAGVTYKRMAGAGALANQAVPITEFNRVLAPGIRSPWSAREFEDALDWLQRYAANGWAFQISPAAQPSEINEWATVRNLEPTGNGWAKWYRPASMAMPRPSGSDLEVCAVSHDHGAEFGRVVQQGFGLPESTIPWFAALPGRLGWRTYLAFDGQRPVAAGAMFINGQWAWLGVDATLTEARRRGAQSGIIARRLADGVAAGVLGFTAETANPPAGEEASYSSFRNYGKAGFSLAYVRPNYKLRQPS
ncbi:MAG: hypothetical protein ACRC67_16980 [Inquilinus sp.]|uniref:hypothetical protein n=1 Tax=Inquilinus sp. TaxID=1932117 RepID=UPI003F2DE1AB